MLKETKPIEKLQIGKPYVNKHTPSCRMMISEIKKTLCTCIRLDDTEKSKGKLYKNISVMGFKANYLEEVV